MPWDDVGVALRRERNRRHFTVADFSRRIGVGERTLGQLERGEGGGYAIDTIVRVELALGWRAGSVERVVNGQRPIIEEDPDRARIRAVWPGLPAEVRAAIAELVEAIANYPH